MCRQLSLLIPFLLSPGFKEPPIRELVQSQFGLAIAFPHFYKRADVFAKKAERTYFRFMGNALNLPADLPVPQDDGACDHLQGTLIAELGLESTAGYPVNLAQLRGRTVVYCYPRTGQPDQPIPDGWDAIPGARGCTPQSCAFRDHFRDLTDAGASHLFGLSTQDTEYQREVVKRLGLPYPLLSDRELNFVRALNLPTFRFNSMTLIKRLTLIIDDGCITKVFYPVFPPDQSAEQTLDWLTQSQPPKDS
jgi:peroxiredoxin